jgi:hypothetical protein
VTSIGDSAFLFCTNLTSVTFRSPAPPNLGEDAFDCPSLTVYVPRGAAAAYQAETELRGRDIIEI